MQLIDAGVVDQALYIDDVFLVTRIEQQLGAAARARQVDVDDLLDPRYQKYVVDIERLIDDTGIDELHP